MGEWTMVKAADGFEMEAWRAMPRTKPKAGLVVLHEIFGVNPYIREKAEFWAEQGYAVLAPRFWDRLERGVELDYVKADATRARRSFSLVVDRELAVRDLGAIADGLREWGKVGAMGYSWGGTTIWMAAGRINLDCAVGYYAGTRKYSRMDTRFPVQIHLAGRDRRLEQADVDFLKDEHQIGRAHV